MKRFTALLTLAVALIAGCDKKETAKPQAAEQRTRVAVPDPFRAGIGKAYASYLALGGALAHDEFAQAKSACESMLLALGALPKADLDPEARKPWDSLENRLTQVLRPMAEAKDIEAMRERLADATPLMVEAIETFGSLGPEGAYLYHCPMARKNQGADWIQKDRKMENPFFGKSMSECGILVKEVKL